MVKLALDLGVVLELQVVLSDGDGPDTAASTTALVLLWGNVDHFMIFL